MNAPSQRIYLEFIGLLPVRRASTVQDDPNPQKRRLIAQHSLDQKGYYAALMTFWNDIEK